MGSFRELFQDYQVDAPMNSDVPGDHVLVRQSPSLPTFGVPLRLTATGRVIAEHWSDQLLALLFWPMPWKIANAGNVPNDGAVRQFIGRPGKDPKEMAQRIAWPTRSRQHQDFSYPPDFRIV